MLSKQTIDWIFVDEELPEGSDRLLFAESEPNDSTASPPDPQQRSTLQTRVYELAIAFVCIYTLAAFLAWQVVERRMSTLEDELLAVSSKLVKAQSDADTNPSTVDLVNSPGHQTLDTEFLHFEFAASDAQAVRLIAARCNHEYRNLRTNFGLPRPLADQKLTITTLEPSSTQDRYDTANTLRISSLSVAAQQYSISTSEALKNEVYLQMMRHTAAAAIAARQIKPQWLALVEAIKYTLWADIYHRDDWRQNELFLTQRYAAQTRALTLTYAPLEYGEQAQELFMQPMIANEVAGPLIEYILATYGHAAIGSLLDAFEQHDSWETLAPALFQMSAAELEEEWHGYLAQRYPKPAK